MHFHYRLTFAALSLAPLGLAAQSAGRPPSTLVQYDVRDLPLVEMPPVSSARARTAAESTLVVMLTGDGDWAEIDKGIATALSASGAAIIGLKSRTYLQAKPRTPDVLARDVDRIARHYMPLWGRDRLVVLGYSRGADFVPFVGNRLSPDLREHVALLAMFGMETSANFEFHWLDMMKDTKRPSDLPVAPELARLRGTRMLCVYGADEKDSGCRDADPSIIQRVQRGGAHHFDKDYTGLGALVLQSMARR